MEGLLARKDQWYNTVAKPYLDAHRADVEAAAKASTVAEYGPLLETCEAGTQCRAENKRIIEEAIKAEWAKVLLSFRTDVDATVLKTRKLIKEGYDVAVECQLNEDCCEVSDVVYTNLIIQINQHESLIGTKWTHWQDLERRRLEIETDCPAIDYSVVYAQYRTYEI